MTLNFKYVEGSQETQPLEIDDTSSKIVVYIRRNIQQIEKPSEDSLATISYWGYEEAQLTHDQYRDYKIEQNHADLEYISMMADIELGRE